jgi:hypothetical protein
MHIGAYYTAAKLTAWFISWKLRRLGMEPDVYVEVVEFSDEERK